VKIPFRVDIEFKVEDASERFGYGSDEGSIRFITAISFLGSHGKQADSRAVKEPICFNSQSCGIISRTPSGKIRYNEYNTLT
jgi:hypothetical protein